MYPPVPGIRKASATWPEALASCPLCGAEQEKVFPKGAAIFHEGDPPDHLYTLRRGRVKLVKLSPEGEETILEILRAGEPLDAIAVLDGRPHSAGAVALTEARLFLISRRRFLDFLQAEPALA